MVAVNLSAIFIPSLIASLMRNSKTGPQLSEHVDVQQQYDYVIVGSGWAGSILANRLSQDSGTTVLLLEAGAKDNTSTELPLLSLPQHGAGYDWQYQSVPQGKMCWGNPGKKCVLASGKVAGGSSTIGEWVHSRGNVKDHDDMGNAVPGWSYKEVLPFYKKSEDFHDQNDECLEDEENSCGGEVYIGPVPPRTKSETCKYFIQGVKEQFGLESKRTIKDENGIDLGHYFMKKGVRVSAASAFLKPIAHKRKNLHISLNSFVNKIVIDPVTKKATGVEFVKGGQIQTVEAKKEVLLSAGTYQSPKILMLSGIGPKEHLQKFNIPVIADLPGVGQNYMDIPFGTIIFSANRSISDERKNVFTAESFKRWTSGKGGILATPSGIDAGYSWRSSFADSNSTGPDLAYVFQSLELHELFAIYLKRALGYNDEIWNKYFVPQINTDLVNVQVSIGQVKSKGTIQLQSSNPKDYPLIDPNFFNDPDEIDLKKMVEGFRLGMQLVNTSLFKQHGYEWNNITMNECEQIKDQDSYKFFECHLKYNAIPRWFGCCSNKMGPKSDQMAVVDERLRVFGISGLRVVDSSVLPNHLRAPTGASTIMIGEKAAHMINEDNH